MFRASLILFLLIAAFLSACQRDSRTSQQFTCPMHPNIVSDRPGRCPICGMDLVVRTDQQKHAAQTGHADSHAAFELNTAASGLLGLRTTTAEIRDLKIVIYAYAWAASDPELFNAINEYINAKNLLSSPKSLHSIRAKLELLGVAEKDISVFANDEDALANLLTPKGNPWIYAEFKESALAYLENGAEIEVQIPGSQKHERYIGKIQGISPILDPESRTVRVRFQVKDPDKQIKANTIAKVSLTRTLEDRLIVPENAVLKGGKDEWIFLVSKEGLVIPRKVRLGAQSAEYIEILEGVQAGDQIASSANFLLDSEARLKSLRDSAAQSNSNHKL